MRIWGVIASGVLFFGFGKVELTLAVRSDHSYRTRTNQEMPGFTHQQFQKAPGSTRLQSLQALDRVHNALPQRPIRQTQYAPRPPIVETIRALLGIIPRLQRPPLGQICLQLRKRVRDDLRNLLVAKPPTHNEEALPACLVLLGGEYVG